LPVPYQLSTETKIGFYRSGLSLLLDKGKLVAIEPWMPCHEERGNAEVPDLSYLQLVFGYHTYEDLEQSSADCTYKDDETRVLLSTIFPKKASSVMFLN
jgi:hypothetical protein